ncbi:MAG: hypothetical protein R3242_00710 [Akkermansiaceae bacterium]|nr:hypothetical protein [Akkermansiaceae bacterium]
MVDESSPFSSSPDEQPPEPKPAAVPQLTPQEPDADPWDFAELCLEQTAAAIHESRAATPTELNSAMSAARDFHIDNKPADLIEVLARVQGHEEENLGPALMDLADKVAATLTPSPPVIPFGGKLMAPSSFYEQFDRIHEIARILLSPVLYAEDTDAVGTASMNPVACKLLAGEIAASVHKRFGIRPFVSAARLDYETWSFLTRKHFEL